MKIRLYLKIVDTKTGKVEVDRESHSWVIQFPQILCAHMASKYTDQIRDTGNTLRNYQTTAQAINVNAAATVITYGIVIGTGTTAEDATQYKLTTQIINGSGSGQAVHSAVTIVESSVVGTTAIFTVARTFTNNYATADLLVKEIGIYAQVSLSTTCYFMLARDLENITIVKAGGSKTITYTVTVDNTS